MKTQESNTTYKIQYLFSTTASYLVGAAPTVLLFLFLTVSGGITVALCVVLPQSKVVMTKENITAHRIDADSNDHQTVTFNYSLITQVSLQIVVTVVALATNYGFVEIFYFSKTSNLSAVQFSLAVVKSIFTSFIIPYSGKFLPKSSRQLYTVAMTIIVSVVAPGLAIFLTSPLCLRNKIIRTTVNISYDYDQFVCPNRGGCVWQLYPSSITFTPPWFYSYQCSSSFLNSYLPSFIYLYMIKGIITPTLNLLAVIVLTGANSNYFKRASAYLASIRGHSIFYVYDKDEHENQIEMHTVSPSLDKTTKPSEEYTTDVSEVIPGLCIDITLLLTFGLAFPLLAVTITFSVIVNTLLLRLAVGRYICIMSKEVGHVICYERLENAFGDSWQCLRRSWWIMTLFIGMFWSLFVNDMVGYKNPSGAIAAAIIIFTWILFAFISMQTVLEFDSTTSDEGSYRSRAQKVILNLSSSIHKSVWFYIEYILRVNRETVVVAINDSNDVRINDSRESIMTETISPLTAVRIQ